MSATLLFHILAGGLGLVAGYTALVASKGEALHRRAGTVFVYAMLAMGTAGFTIAVVRDVAPEINVPAALLTSYLVVTAWTTVRPPAAGMRVLHLGGLTVALVVGLTMTAFGIDAVVSGGKRNGMPAFPFFMFAVVGLLGSAGDIRVIRRGALRGASRLARHLWRMCFALFIAALSFFIGQADVFPAQFRIMPLLALPMLAVLATMFYWLWRVRSRRPLSGLLGARSRESGMSASPLGSMSPPAARRTGITAP